MCALSKLAAKFCCLTLWLDLLVSVFRLCRCGIFVSATVVAALGDYAMAGLAVHIYVMNMGGGGGMRFGLGGGGEI